MISKLEFPVFQDVFINWLCEEHFKVAVFSQRSIEQYFEEFSRYSNSQFEELCKLAFREKFLPCVNWFHEQGQVIRDRDRREAEVFIPQPQISEEKRLFNVAKVNQLTAQFFGDRSW